MIITAILSLLAGILTVFAPCVLPFLPVIIGGSLRDNDDRRRPFLIAGALVVSILLFTILLKATTLVININPRVWEIFSGVLVIILGIFILFPDLWAKLTTKSGFDAASHTMLDKAQKQRHSTVAALLTGAALGPVFNSCSPTYAWVIATILPFSPLEAMVYLGFYTVGLAGTLLIFSLAGRKLIAKFEWATNPKGLFQRCVAVLFIIVGVLVATGVDRTFQAWAAQAIPGLTQVEEKLIPNSKNTQDSKEKTKDAQDSTSQSKVFNAHYAAPELEGIEHWLNSKPLKLKDLRGKVVLIDFWTYSCINCIRTQPYLNSWYEKYHDKGFEIIGVHAPEFAFEKIPDNVERALKEESIKYPVAMDNNYATWRAFDNHYWPAKYLIDKEGTIRFTHFGEGEYDTTEKAIQNLLNVSQTISTPSAPPTPHQGQSPETYLGAQRVSQFVGEPFYDIGTHTYTPEKKIPTHGWTLGGQWKADEEKITAQSSGATLSYRFSGKEMFLVIGGPSGSKVKVNIEGHDNAFGKDVVDKTITIDSDRLYHIASLPEFKEGTLVTLTFDKSVSAHAFTFG
ncbi:MAG: cytochrome c biogenesis protein DipZ [Actinomycetaceae bacterium]|nr:cytochrome c biogenesis protein DipZ [Actinomycetaceae bacterium]